MINHAREDVVGQVFGFYLCTYMAHGFLAKRRRHVHALLKCRLVMTNIGDDNAGERAGSVPEQCIAFDASPSVKRVQRL